MVKGVHTGMANEMKAQQEKIGIDTKSLKDLAIYLSGLRDGKGDLLPLGTITLEHLWNAIKYLEGDVRYKAERDNKL